MNCCSGIARVENNLQMEELLYAMNNGQLILARLDGLSRESIQSVRMERILIQLNAVIRSIQAIHC